MVPKTILIAALIAYVEARFGQEQVPIAAISAVKGGASGAAATIAGATISDLLGAANSCAKLSRADEIVAQLGGGADAIAAAKGLVAAEKNTNPFANGNAQNVCGDASLPATPELRGITPLIDPAVDVNGGVAALSKKSLATPLNADGKSVFDLLSEAGFGDLVKSQAAAGGAAATGGNNANAGAATGGNNANAGAVQAGGNNATQDATQQQGQAANGKGNGKKAKGKKAKGNKAKGNANGAAANNQNAQGAAQACSANNAAAAANSTADATAGNQQSSNAGNAAAGNAATGNAATGNGATAGAKSTIAGADFGKCTPTITFQGGEGNRPATEFTFQIADPVARGGQGEALNPNIITNALCNQLTNVCNANAAAKAACLDGKAKVAAAGTRDKSTADLFNAAVGFAGAVTNPKGGPANPPAKAVAGAKRAMRRGLRL